MMEDWRALLDIGVRENQLGPLRNHGRTGGPLGNATFVQRLENAIGRILLPVSGDN